MSKYNNIFSVPIHVPEMFKTNFMIQIQRPTWALLNQLVSKSSLSTLDQLQNDYIIQDFAKPVLTLIEKAFNPTDGELDPILANWSSRSIQRKAKDQKNRIQALQERAGLNVHTKMVRLDDEIEEILTKTVQTSWFKVARATFANGPQIVCFPVKVEQAIINKEKLDPTPFDESHINVTSDFEFHVENQHSQSLFPLEPMVEEESMDPIEIIAVSSLTNDN